MSEKNPNPIVITTDQLDMIRPHYHQMLDYPLGLSGTAKTYFINGLRTFWSVADETISLKLRGLDKNDRQEIVKEDTKAFFTGSVIENIHVGPVSLYQNMFRKKFIEEAIYFAQTQNECTDINLVQHLSRNMPSVEYDIYSAEALKQEGVEDISLYEQYKQEDGSYKIIANTRDNYINAAYKGVIPELMVMFRDAQYEMLTPFEKRLHLHIRHKSFNLGHQSQFGFDLSASQQWTADDYYDFSNKFMEKPVSAGFEDTAEYFLRLHDSFQTFHKNDDSNPYSYHSAMYMNRIFQRTQALLHQSIEGVDTVGEYLDATDRGFYLVPFPCEEHIKYCEEKEGKATIPLYFFYDNTRIEESRNIMGYEDFSLTYRHQLSQDEKNGFDRYIQSKCDLLAKERNIPSVDISAYRENQKRFYVPNIDPFKFGMNR